MMAILGLLVALLLPAIQQARETARRMACRAHLKQLGIALHGYHDAHNCYPPAYSRPGPASGGGGTGCGVWGWGTMLLPYLDQQPLYNALNPSGEKRVFGTYFAAHGRVLPEAQIVLDVFRCPTSLLPDQSQDLGPDPLPAEVLGFGTSDYKGCASCGYDQGIVPGVFGRTPFNVAQFTKGASHTIALGESSHPWSGGDHWPTWVGPCHVMENIFGTHVRMNSVSNFTGRYWMNIESNDAALSCHPGVCNFLYGDGSVHTLDEDMDFKTYDDLGCYRGKSDPYF